MICQKFYFQVLHRAEVRPAGAVHPGGEGGAAVQAAAGRAQAGARHQLRGPARQGGQHSLHREMRSDFRLYGLV